MDGSMACGAYGLGVLTGVAHTAVCVPDVDEAVTWYTTVLGLRLLSPPYRMEGDAIERDMGELVPSTVVLKAAIVGLGDDDRVLEVIEYPNVPARSATDDASITDVGITHIGLVCDDIRTTRAELEGRGVIFLTAGVADVAGVRTAWFRDPWAVVFILIEKRHPDLPYWRQHD
jgi:catechol 2,3-dioxygenase-like lactoylglutathione lyase family enzyme